MNLTIQALKTFKHLVIDSEEKTVFLAMISGRDDGVVVRFYPKIDVEKTEGVKKILVELAKQLIATFPELRIGETNLGNYLKIFGAPP